MAVGIDLSVCEFADCLGGEIGCFLVKIVVDDLL